MASAETAPAASMPTSTQGVLGIIAGTSLLHSDTFKTGLEEVVVQTDHGAVRLYKSVGDHAQFGRPIVFVQRHRADPAQDYTLPHAINRPAVALALKAMGVTAVVAFNSVGSLQTNLPPNTVLVPHDFLCFWKCDYVYNDNRAHLVPGYHTGMRNALLNVLNEGGFKPVDKGVYVQTHGPRFETPAEVRVLTSYGDIVGMTGTDEAVVTQEVGIPYACICMIDNYANGVTASALTYTDFKGSVANNVATVTAMSKAVLEKLQGVYN